MSGGGASGLSRVDGTGAPSGMGLYNSAPGASSTPDTGTSTAYENYARAQSYRQRYVAPTAGYEIDPSAVVNAGAPTGTASTDSQKILDRQAYYAGPTYPVKYDVPTEADERFQARAEIRRAAGKQAGLDKGAVMRTDPITEGEVDMLMDMKKKGEVADFDAYVGSLVDPRKPGSLKWLMEIYPDYVKRRLQQVHTDYEFALRNQMIDMWGMNTFDDLHFKYLVDQKKITGPHLQTDNPPKDQYAPGLLSPWAFRMSNDIRADDDGKLRAPFSSAKFGSAPARDTQWFLDDGSNLPLSGGRGTRTLASSMYEDIDKAGTTLKVAGPGFARTQVYTASDGTHADDTMQAGRNK